jgi:hypothetical protein
MSFSRKWMELDIIVEASKSNSEKQVSHVWNLNLMTILTIS